MRKTCVVLFVVAAATALLAQLSAGQTPPGLAAAQRDYSRAKASARLDGDLKRAIDEIDRAVAEAIRLGRTGEAFRLLAKGAALASGWAWTDKAEFAASVVLHADRLFIDPSTRLALRIEQLYTSALELDAPLTARITLRRFTRGTESPTGRGQVGGTALDFGSFSGVPRDLRQSPFVADLSFRGVADGAYVVVVELSEGGQALVARGLAIEVKKSLDPRLERLAAGARSGSELAQALNADLLYPADYMQRVNTGVIEPGDFDLEKELRDAEATLDALNRHRDPFAGRTGDFKRHYLMPESGEIVPYHLYVPTSCGGRKACPLVVALHGSGANEDSFFQGGARQVPDVAEERGFLVAAPLGYRVDGGYGRTTSGGSRGPAAARTSELSEADVLHVIDLVRKAYRVDEDRVYLFGHSMGASGAWHLAAKYPGRWAAIACFSGRGVPATVDEMGRVAQFVVHGDADAVVPVASSRAMVAEMKRLGVDYRYIEVRGGDHAGVVDPHVADAFAFFEKHRRKAPASARM